MTLGDYNKVCIEYDEAYFDLIHAVENKLSEEVKRPLKEKLERLGQKIEQYEDELYEETYGA